jgi:predicted O-methyltransferase YrrM
VECAPEGAVIRALAFVYRFLIISVNWQIKLAANPLAHRVWHHRLVHPLACAVLQRVRRLGLLAWGTKSFECWTALCVVLEMVRPKGIVEIGSGRGTSYLGEYALKHDADLAAIEESMIWARKVRRGMRNSFLSDRFIRHVPLARDGWYEAGRLQRATPFSCDCLFLDGPARGRTMPRAVDWYVRLMAGLRMMIVDDLQWRSVHTMFQQLAALRPDFETLYFEYCPEPNQLNVVAISLEAPLTGKLKRVCDIAGIPYLREFSADRCSEN